MIALAALAAVMTDPAPIADMLAFDGVVHKSAFVTTIFPACAAMPECYDMQRQAFDNIRLHWHELTATQEAEALAALEKNGSNGYHNWHAFLHPPVRYRPPYQPSTRTRVTCSTRVSKSGRRVTTSCW